MASFIDELERIKNQVVTYAGGLSAALDFGAGAQNNVQPRENPEMDTFDLGGSNIEDDKILGIEKKYVGYGLAGLGIIVVLGIVNKSIK
jgi:hypothetical protein